MSDTTQATMLERTRWTLRTLVDRERDVRDTSLPAAIADAPIAARHRDALTRDLGHRSATPAVRAELMAHYAPVFAALEDRIAAPDRLRAELAELREQIAAARHAVAMAERDAGGEADRLHAWGMRR
jgi:hypothetical protein